MSVCTRPCGQLNSDIELPLNVTAALLSGTLVLVLFWGIVTLFRDVLFIFVCVYYGFVLTGFVLTRMEAVLLEDFFARPQW